MRIALGSIDIDATCREAVGARITSAPGYKATREQVRRFVLDNGTIALDDLVHEFEQEDRSTSTDQRSQ